LPLMINNLDRSAWEESSFRGIRVFRAKRVLELQMLARAVSNLTTGTRRDTAPCKTQGATWARLANVGREQEARLTSHTHSV
jgi:hypothetical protein